MTLIGKVIHDFVGETEEELSVKEGESVEVLRNDDDGWCLCLYKSCKGLLPQSYITIIEPPILDNQVDNQLPKDEIKDENVLEQSNCISTPPLNRTLSNSSMNKTVEPPLREIKKPRPPLPPKPEKRVTKEVPPKPEKREMKEEMKEKKDEEKKEGTSRILRTFTHDAPRGMKEQFQCLSKFISKRSDMLKFKCTASDAGILPPRELRTPRSRIDPSTFSGDLIQEFEKLQMENEKLRKYIQELEEERSSFIERETKLKVEKENYKQYYELEKMKAEKYQKQIARERKILEEGWQKERKTVLFEYEKREEKMTKMMNEIQKILNEFSRL